MTGIQQFFQNILPYLQGFWAEIIKAALFLLFGWWFGMYRARGQWKKRQFFTRLNVSLNVIKNNKLMIRTIVESQMNEVFLNKAAADLVVKTAKNTTPEDPILPLPEKDRWIVHNEILNQLSEHFADGLIRYDLGLKVKGAIYVIALTCEKAGEVRTQKVRAMMIRRRDLLNLPEEMPKLEHPVHETRYHTLKAMAKRFHDRPMDFIQMAIYQ